ncbi:Gfo/Idh/MocA family protein [Microbacterium sp. MC2]
MRVRIGLAGVHGHGRGHVEAALALADAGTGHVVAVADPQGPGVVPDGVAHHRDAADMIAREDLDIVVLSTPIPTHAALAEAALRRGAHVLLEKPPVTSTAEHARLRAVEEATGRVVQVGFQSLASAGVAATIDAAASLGEIRHIGAVGVWERSEQYWRRSDWAGYRHRDGQVIADGAVTNPLAHAVATALAVAGAREPADVASVELDMYRANDIATDDTSSLRLRLRDGTTLVAALATTGDRRHEPYVLVRGTRGHLVYFYTLDLLQVFRAGAVLPQTFSFARAGLLAQLCAHARDGVGPAVPLAATGAFTRVLEEIVTGPDATPLPPARFDTVTRGAERFRVVGGIAGIAERAAWEAALFREIVAF